MLAFTRFVLSVSTHVLVKLNIFCQFSAVLYSGFACAAVDTLASGLLYLAVGQLQILKDSLENLDKNIEHEKTKSSNSESVYNYIVNCILHYNDILE